MSVDLSRTLVVHCRGLAANKSLNIIVDSLSKVQCVQFIPNGRIRVTFSDMTYRNAVLAKGEVVLFGHPLRVTESDLPLTTVYLHFLPVQFSHDMVRLALGPFGDISDIKLTPNLCALSEPLHGDEDCQDVHRFPHTLRGQYWWLSLQRLVQRATS